MKSAVTEGVCGGGGCVGQGHGAGHAQVVSMGQGLATGHGPGVNTKEGVLSQCHHGWVCIHHGPAFRTFPHPELLCAHREFCTQLGLHPDTLGGCQPERMGSGTVRGQCSGLEIQTSAPRELSV